MKYQARGKKQDEETQSINEMTLSRAGRVTDSDEDKCGDNAGVEAKWEPAKIRAPSLGALVLEQTAVADEWCSAVYRRKFRFACTAPGSLSPSAEPELAPSGHNFASDGWEVDQALCGVERLQSLVYPQRRRCTESGEWWLGEALVPGPWRREQRETWPYNKEAEARGVIVEAREVGIHGISTPLCSRSIRACTPTVHPDIHSHQIGIWPAPDPHTRLSAETSAPSSVARALGVPASSANFVLYQFPGRAYTQERGAPGIGCFVRQDRRHMRRVAAAGTIWTGQMYGHGGKAQDDSVDRARRFARR
ncbi:hypothetical protein B0H19DRAFT_1060278 [Mycena capillaripes]|nr:hypothetical protein B0H19DRAFT_1060278 [Mycena capillaripes]